MHEVKSTLSVNLPLVRCPLPFIPGRPFPKMSWIALCGTLLFITGCAREKSPLPPLLCYVGGTMRPVIEELSRLYGKETRQQVDIDYADSGQLLFKIETTKKGDLYVCHDPFLDVLMRRGLGRQGWTVASLTPVIAVPKGNPKGIRRLRDLARPGLKIGLTDEKYSTLGHVNPVMFHRAALRPQIEKNVVMRSRMGGEVANAVVLGALDATIVWNAVAHARNDKLDAIEIEPRYHPPAGMTRTYQPTGTPMDLSYIRVTMATLKCSKHPKAARAFAEFVNSSRGQAAFKKYGFSPARR